MGWRCRGVVALAQPRAIVGITPPTRDAGLSREKGMRKLAIGMAISAGTLAMLPALAQTAPPLPTAQGDTVSRAEYEALKRDQEEMRRELIELRRERPGATMPPAARG